MSIMELSIYSIYGNLKVLVSDMLNISKVSSGSGELSEIVICSVINILVLKIKKEKVIYAQE